MKMTLMMKIQIINMYNNSDANQNDDDADEKNDFNKFKMKKLMMKKTLKKMVNLNQMTIQMKKKKNKGGATHHAKGPMTNQNY